MRALTKQQHAGAHNQWEHWMSDFKNTPPWQSIHPPAGNLPRHPNKLRMVIDELDVENSPRYKPTPAATYCNIFAADVLNAMGLQPGHWMRLDGEPASDGEPGAWEMTANRMCRWFIMHGKRFGWEPADRPTAQDAAARGHVVVVCWDSAKGTPGHIAIMLPEGTIAQAGRHNFVGQTISQGFGKLPVKFFVQLHGGSHNA